MRPGAVVADRFEVDRLAGTGGMGRVYRAKDRLTGGVIALKVIHSERDEPRFEHEAEVLSSITHPGVVAYVAHGRSSDGEMWLAMEWLEGEDLAQRIQRSPLAVDESIDLGRRVADALGAAHEKGVVHRDVKPSNVFLMDKTIERVKVLDFGVARGMDTRPSTMTGVTLGTPGYMAPEQARGDRDLDARADVFALGCVLFECLTRRPAFIGQHALALLAKILLEDAPRVREVADVPRALDDLVGRMLAKDPKARPRDGYEVASELAALVGEQPPSSKSSLAPPSLGRVEQRLVSVVMVKGLFSSSRSKELAGPASPDAPTLEATTPAAVVAELRDLARRFGAELEPLADGSVVVRIEGARGGTDQAGQAARCALALRAAIPSSPIALATGRAVMGRSLHVGEAIDRVSRLVQRVPRGIKDPRGVRLDDVTQGLLGARFEVEKDGDALRLLRELDVVEGATPLLGEARPCVGRDRELALLDSVFAEVVGERVARAVLITAPAGLGKSRLLTEFLTRLRARDEATEVWAGGGNPVSGGSPFALAGRALRRTAGVVQGEPLETRREKLLARVKRHVPADDALRVAEFLGELGGVPFSDEGRVELKAARQDPIVLGDQMRRAFEDFLGAECAAHPVVLVLEDLHWGDLPSVRLVDDALRNLDETAPLFVVALARPEIKDQFPNIWQERNLQIVHLAALTKKSSERLVRDALGAGVSEARVAEILERAAGNAFYLEELVRAVAAGSKAALPDSVLAMVEARLEGLTADARRVLRAASVFGEVFWTGGVAALVGSSSGRALDRVLRELEDRELVRQAQGEKFPSERELAFRHGLVREAAYRTLTDADRSLGHRLAAEWLEQAGEGEPLVLADHFDRGNAPDRAARYFHAAAERALGANDFAAVLERAKDAIRCDVRGETLGHVRLLEAEAHDWRGESAESLTAAREALALLPAGSAAFCIAAGEAAIGAGRLADRATVVDVAKTLRDLERPYAVAARAIAGARATTQLLVLGRYDLARELLDSIECDAPELEGDPIAIARLALARAFSSHFDGDSGVYLEELRVAAEGFERAGDRRNACTQRGNIGHAYIELGAHEEAESALVEALAAAERMSLRHIAAVARHNLGLVLGLVGRFEEAVRFESAAERDFIAQADQRLTTAARVYLAQIHLLAGDVEAADHKVKEALDADAGEPLVALALATSARVDLARGLPEEAFDAASRALDILERLGGVDEGESLIRLVHAEAAFALGRVDTARAGMAFARERLLERADKIKDGVLRLGMLACVPDNTRILTFASELGA